MMLAPPDDPPPEVEPPPDRLLLLPPLAPLLLLLLPLLPFSEATVVSIELPPRPKSPAQTCHDLPIPASV